MKPTCHKGNAVCKNTDFREKKSLDFASKTGKPRLVLLSKISSRWRPEPINVKHKLQYAVAAAKSLQSCQTVCDPIDGSPPGSPVPGIL